MTNRASGKSLICGIPIHIRVSDLMGREIDAVVGCTKARGHHAWAGIRRDPVHTYRAESSNHQHKLSQLGD